MGLLGLSLSFVLQTGGEDSGPGRHILSASCKSIDEHESSVRPFLLNEMARDRKA